MVDVGEVVTKWGNEYTSTKHAGTNRLLVASVDVWQPRKGEQVQIEQIEARIVELHFKFRLHAVAYDPWQAEYLAQRLRKNRVNCAVPFQAANLTSMATETISAFKDHTLAIGHNLEWTARLRDDLCASEL